MNYFDLHCDTATECYDKKKKLRDNDLNISLEKGQFLKKWTQVFAVWLPDEYRGEAAYDYFNRVYQYFMQELLENKERINLCMNMIQAEEAFSQGKKAAFLAIEGGAALGGKIKNLEEVYNKGVRLMTLTWNASCELGDGCMVSNPKGLTSFGKQVVKRMTELEMMVDVSHLSEAGFWDVVKIVQGPFIATHSNAYSLCPHPRNLTDAQFKELVNLKGLVGMNFYPVFLNGSKEAGIDDLIRHIEYFLNIGGQDVLAIGSDFDGALMPKEIEDIQDIYKLEERLQSEYGRELSEKICFTNAQRFFNDFFKKGGVEKPIQIC